MTTSMQRIYNIIFVIRSWVTLPFLGTKNIKRFLPASIIIIIFEIINVIIGKKRNWWIFYNNPNSYFANEFPYNIGPFFIVSLWFLKWGYGNFNKFIFMNVLGNLFYAYPYSFAAEKLKYFKLNITNAQFFRYFIYKAFLLYGLQYMLEKGKPITK